MKQYYTKGEFERISSPLPLALANAKKQGSHPMMAEIPVQLKGAPRAAGAPLE
jgi:hypothetical protein